ncbi:MAG: HIRAN domain-containing protein, partial [Acidimicrobiia bacterium]
TLFPVIANRLMSRDRPNHERFLNRLGLDADADIFDELERGGGARVTDSIELFPVPRVDSGVLSTRFFVRGIRHVEGGPEAARRLREGSRLFLRPEPDNPVNDRAVLLDVETGVSVGYAPDYLADVIHTIHQWAGDWPSVVVERVNRDAPAANMVLAELSGTCPRDYRPFSETDYAPLARDLADLDAALSEVGSNALG